MTLDFIRSLAEEAGEMAMQSRKTLSSKAIEFKSDKDIVTEVDKAVETFIVGELAKAFPEHATYGEEFGKSAKAAKAEYCWIIDPIDGTTSFVHGQPFYSVSIALHRKGVPVLAAVCAPRLGETFCAQKGMGAFVNGERLQVSKRDKLISSVLSTGFACLRSDLEENNLAAFTRIVPKLRGVRRYGSAAIDMAFVAAGRLEGFWEMNLKIYDIAAGELLVTEAGGRVCDFNGGSDYPKAGTLATNGLIDSELLPLLSKGKPGRAQVND